MLYNCVILEILKKAGNDDCVYLNATFRIFPNFIFHLSTVVKVTLIN